MDFSSVDIFEYVLAAIAFIIGSFLFVYLLSSSILNYKKNHSYSVGAIFILSCHVFGFLLALFIEKTVPLGELAAFSFITFGCFMVTAIVFYILFLAIKIGIEKIP